MRTIYVQVGHPCQKPPCPFVTELHVQNGEERSAAKLHRIDMAKHPSFFGLEIGVKFTAADFYYAVFGESTCENLLQDSNGNYIASDNYFTRVKMGDSLLKDFDLNYAHESLYVNQGRADFFETGGTKTTHLPQGELFQSYYRKGWDEAARENLSASGVHTSPDKFSPEEDFHDIVNTNEYENSQRDN